MAAHARAGERVGKSRHRADYSSPPPSGVSTGYTRYLADLVVAFGPESVAGWGRVEVTVFDTSTIRLRCNGATFHATRVLWGTEPHEYAWSVRRGGRVLTRVVRGGTHVGTVDRALEVEVLVQALAPTMPPAHWSFDAWRLRRGV